MTFKILPHVHILVLLEYVMNASVLFTIIALCIHQLDFIKNIAELVLTSNNLSHEISTFHSSLT